MGQAQLLAELIDVLSPEDIKGNSQSIHDLSQIIYNLLDNLLKWTQLQLTGISYDPAPLNLRGLVDQSLNVLDAPASSKNINLYNKVDQVLTVQADQEMQETVVRNLTLNAIKFTPQGGQVTISARPKKTSFVEVLVSDTGIGIDPKNMVKLFKLDHHHRAQGTANEKGSGLGLIICQEMIQRHGGQIWAKSLVGYGTTLHFTVPAS